MKYLLFEIKFYSLRVNRGDGWSCFLISDVGIQLITQRDSSLRAT
jgi:hypothetical protein